MKIKLGFLKKIIKEEIESTMSEEKLLSKLNWADWDYERSDDHRAWQEGRDAIARIRSMLRSMAAEQPDVLEGLLNNPKLHDKPRMEIEFALRKK